MTIKLAVESGCVPIAQNCFTPFLREEEITVFDISSILKTEIAANEDAPWCEDEYQKYIAEANPHEVHTFGKIMHAQDNQSRQLMTAPRSPLLLVAGCICVRCADRFLNLFRGQIYVIERVIVHPCCKELGVYEAVFHELIKCVVERFYKTRAKKIIIPLRESEVEKAMLLRDGPFGCKSVSYGFVSFLNRGHFPDGEDAYIFHCDKDPKGRPQPLNR